MTTTKTKRRPLTRDMLLPLTVQKAREISLENHLALSVLAADLGGDDQATKLLITIYHARFMVDSDMPDKALLDAVESTLNVIVTRVESGAAWEVTDAEHAVIAQSLAIHDRLMASVPWHRFATAWGRVQGTARWEWATAA